MITFIDEKGTEHSALVAYSVTNAVNGELSVKGTIYTNDKVLHGIGRGWRFRLDDEYYRITYAKPNDTGRQIEVEFDAVHQFFYDMSKSMVYTTLNGSKPFETYLQAIFSGSGYTYNLETTVGPIRKENFGNKSRLSLFNDIIKAAGLEFSVRGHVVRILKRIGTDLSTIVRKDFNMNELKIEKDINSFVTYQRGFGAWKDDEDHSKGRYETSYESPLSAIYGRIEADPIVDERYKETGKLLERLKENVDKSYKVSIEIDMEDLSRAGYRISRPNPGDYIMAINENLGFRQKVRIVSFTSEYDVGGNLISRKVICNDIGTVQRATSEISHLSRTLTDSIEGSERALQTATRALVSADGKNTNYFGDVKPLDVPKGTLRKGDRLFLTVGEKKQLYFWNGAEWELEPTEFDHEKFDMEFNRKSQEIKKAIQENRQKAEEALRNSGASSLLAQEAKRIGLDSVAKLEEFKRQATSVQTALSGDLDALKQTVNNEVNQTSEFRRITTEALSRITGQMNGFATKSEVKQGIDGLTQTFAKMRVGGTNLLKGSKGPFMPDRKPANFDNNVLYVGNTSVYMEQGQEYIISAKTDGNFTAHHDGNKESDNVVLWIMDKDVRNYQIVSDLKTGTTGTKIIWNRPTGIYHLRVNTYHKEAVKSVWDVKVEKGNVATDWSPAIEDTDGLITEAKATFERTAQGLRTDLAAIQEYVNKDGQRQEALQRYTREESARQATAVRELVNRDFVGKSTFQESVQGVERRLESLSLGTSGNLLKNSNDGFYNQHDKRYRLVETLQANQTYTLVTKYWHGDKSTGHTFLDGIRNWRRLTYNRAIDAWMVQFTPTQEIPAGTEITLSSDPADAKGNMSWATLVRGSIPLIHWQPAKGDVEEGVTQKLAEYKETVDGRFATISSQINGKANQSDFQRVKETSQLYERIIGSSESDIAEKVARMAMTSQLFQVEVAKNASNGQNLLKGTKSFSGDWKNMAAGWKKHSDKYQGCDVLFKNNSWNGIGQEIDANIGEIYTFSLWMKSDWKNDTVNFYVNKNGSVEKGWGVPSETSVAITSEWKRYSFTFKITANGFIFPRVERLNQHTNLYVAGLKLEKGSYATPYTEAPEDTDEAIRTVQSQLAGSWGVHNKNSVNEIIAGFNLAGRNAGIKAETIRLEGNTLADKLTAIQGYFKRLFVGEGTFATLNADVIRTNSITADKLVMDMAMARRFVSSDLFTDTLAAKEAFINKLRSVVVTATLLEGYRGRIGGFQIGTHDNDPSSFWLTGLDQFKVGMSNGRGREFQTAFWANWGNTWGKPGPLSWYVTLDGQMYCNNNAVFHRVVDFSSTCSVNFYGANSFYKDIYMRNGSEIYGTGSTPRAGGKNSVVWWNQVGDGSLKYHIDRASDRRLKENVTDSNVVALDKIKQLKMKSFDFIRTGKHEEIGLIAQEVESVLPSVISKNPEKENDYLHIDYVAIVPYLIKSIQELNQKIEEMEKTVA